MKKIYLLFGFLMATFLSSNAQVITETDVVEKKIDDLLINIDKSKITNGILYERVHPVSNLKQFNEISSDTSNHRNFLQTYSEMYRSADDKKNFYDLDKFREDKQSMYLDKENIYFGILNIDYSSLNLNENQSENGLKLENEKLYPIEGKEPFVKNKLLMVSPIIGTVVGNHTNFKFDSKYFVQISDNTIESLSFEIDDQKFDVIENGSLIRNDFNIQFSSSGDKTILFEINPKNGNKIITYANIDVVFPSQQNRVMNGLIENDSITAVLPFQGYEESQPMFGHLQYRIYYRTNEGANPILKKPIIVIDGFDPMDHRKFEDTDCRINSECNDFYHGNMSKHGSFSEGFLYGENNSKDVLAQLRAKGYDVILVNQPTHQIPQNNGVTIDGGADYIERNALAHVKLYDSINNRLAANGSIEKLVIVGPSMGGQISRYALAYMEKNNMPHNTRLWLSIDSPHNGANIPMAVQGNVYFLGFVGDGDEEARIMYNNMLKSKAARQQLLYQFNENNPTSFHTTYYNSLRTNGLPNSNGFPMNLRKIAIANGSMTSTTNGLTNQKVLDFPGFKRILGANVKVADSKEWFLPNNGTTQTYYEGLTTTIHWYIFGVTIGQTSRRYGTRQNDVKGSLDASPGGRFYATQLLYESIDKGYRDNDVNGDLRALQGYASFIPTVSSLAFKNYNFNWSSNINRNLLCNNEVPFDSYYAPYENQKHTSFTEENVEWAFGELDGYNMLPSYYTSTSAPPENIIRIVGLSEIKFFTENTYNYIFTGPNTINNVTWTYPINNMQLVLGQGTRNVSFRVLLPGEVTIYATYFDTCMNKNVTVSKTIKLIQGTLDDVTMSGNEIIYASNYCTYQYTLLNKPDNATVLWDISLNRLYYNGNGGLGISVSAHTWGNAYVKATVNYNGQSRIIIKNIYINQTGTCWNPTSINNSVITIYPNPSKTNQSVTISMNFENSENDKVELSVYDQFGVKVSSFRVNNNETFNLDTSRFHKRGVYIIKASNNDKTITERLIIEE